MDVHISFVFIHRFSLYFNKFTIHEKVGESMLDQRLLLYFTTLVEAGSFTNAAKALNISQPSLSAAIKQLEQNVGIILIERSTRKINLTREGEILYEEAKRLIHHFDQVEQEMVRLKEEGPLELKIGLIESVHFWLPKVIATYRKQYPTIQINLTEVLGFRDVAHALKNFKIHVAITNQLFQDESIQTIPIYQENLVVVLPKTHRLEQKNEITIKDLKGEDFIICKEGLQTRNDILNAFNKHNVQPNICFEIERFETACTLVEEHLGVTIVPENYMKWNDRTNVTTKQLTDASLSRTVYCAILRERYLPPVVRQFITLTKQFFTNKKK